MYLITDGGMINLDTAEPFVLHVSDKARPRAYTPGIKITCGPVVVCELYVDVGCKSTQEARTMAKDNGREVLRRMAKSIMHATKTTPYLTTPPSNPNGAAMTATAFGLRFPA